MLGGVEQGVEGGVDRGGEEHEEPELLPHPEPGVQPAGEHGVLGASAQLEIRSQDPCVSGSLLLCFINDEIVTWQIAECEQYECVVITGLVDVMSEQALQSVRIPAQGVVSTQV